jgi:uncharacterized protein
MLEIRPSCEHCKKELPPHSLEARICSYECTFCATCAEEVLANVCPNCGGGFTPRPIRPRQAWCGDSSLTKHPAAKQHTYRPVDLGKHSELRARQNGLRPEQR